MHPDKHPGDDRATKIFQELEQYFDKCVSLYGKHGARPKQRKSTSSPRSNQFPLEFNVEDKWPHIHLNETSHKIPTDCTEAYISGSIAYQVREDI